MPTEPRPAWWSWLSEAWHAGGTGGLSWHLHAHHSRHDWQPTVQALSAFFAHVNPKRPHLLLIGASAGWMMPTTWLQRFARIDAAQSMQAVGLEVNRVVSDWLNRSTP